MAWDKTDLAYAAGIIDGEGCIYIDNKKERLAVKMRMANQRKAG